MRFTGRSKFASLLVLIAFSLCVIVWAERLQVSDYVPSKSERSTEIRFAEEEVPWERFKARYGNICKANQRVQMAFLSKFGNAPVDFNGSRIGVLLTLPYDTDNYYLIQFMTFLYSSWSFVQERWFEVSFPIFPSGKKLNLVDLLVFCEPRSCKMLPSDCSSKISFTEREKDGPRRPTCYHQPTRQFNHEYAALNSYAFVNEESFQRVVSLYDYLLRTDIDTFLSPSILNFQMPKYMSIITGNGGYCSEFAVERLAEIANRLGLKYQGVHCLGSTWLGESRLIAELAPIAAKLTVYLYDNEFDPERYPVLRPYFFTDTKGTWPHWWRPVSSMYAQALVLNDRVENLTNDNIMGDLLDVESCRTSSIIDHLHVHTWHAFCAFSKWDFLGPVVRSLNNHGLINLPIDEVKPKLSNCLSVRKYCTHIAFRGLVRLLEKFTQRQ